MSNDWDFYCVPCEERCGLQDLNHCERELLAVLKHRAAIEALGPALKDIDSLGYSMMADGSFPDVVNFFAKHSGHEVRVRSEYGYFYGQCSDRVRCASCGNHHHCTLTEGHVGPHHNDAVKETEP